MPENNPLPEDMRVSEYMYFRGRLKEVPRRKLGPRIDEVLEIALAEQPKPLAPAATPAADVPAGVKTNRRNKGGAKRVPAAH